MSISLLVLKLRSKRDVVLARERARQVAGLLGFDPVEQAGIAAAVFAIACQARLGTGSARLQFQVGEGILQVFPVRQSAKGAEALPLRLRLEKPLPQGERAVDLYDLPFVIHQLAMLAPPDLFKEIQRQNDELLAVAAELQRLQVALSTSQHAPALPAA
jgi:hypothetical protein